MTPLDRRPCRFGAPERAVSSRFEIDSGPGDARARARRRARVRECAYVHAGAGNRISIGFCRGRRGS